MEVRKIFRAGNSLVVSLPQEILQELDLGEGTQLTITADRQKGEIVLRPFAETGSALITGEFARMVEEFINEYAGVLRELKK